MNRNIERDFQRVRVLIQQKRFGDALGLVEALRTKHPDDFDVVYMQATVLALNGDLAEAVDVYCFAVTLQPGHVEAHVEMGLTLAKIGEYDRALEYFEWALHLEPTNINALRSCGGVLLQLGRDEEAFNTWKKLGDAAEGMIEVQFGLGQLHENRGELDEAQEFYRKVLVFEGDSVAHELARVRLARLTSNSVATDDDVRLEVVMQCLAALQQLSRLERVKIQAVIVEVSLALARGLAVDDPTRKYHLRSLPGTFTGLQVACLLYVGFKVLGQEMNTGLDFGKEYELAVQLWEKEKKNR